MTVLLWNFCISCLLIVKKAFYIVSYKNLIIGSFYLNTKLQTVKDENLFDFEKQDNHYKLSHQFHFLHFTGFLHSTLALYTCITTHFKKLMMKNMEEHQKS